MHDYGSDPLIWINETILPSSRPFKVAWVPHPAATTCDMSTNVSDGADPDSPIRGVGRAHHPMLHIPPALSGRPAPPNQDPVRGLPAVGGSLTPPNSELVALMPCRSGPQSGNHSSTKACNCILVCMEDGHTLSAIPISHHNVLVREDCKGLSGWCFLLF